MHSEIRRAAPARIAYELLESLKGGSALRIFRGLEEASLLGHIVPEAHEAAVGGNGTILWSLLAAADERYRKEEKLGEETLLALLFLPQFLAALQTAGDRLGWLANSSKRRCSGWPSRITVDTSSERAFYC
jgi:tRNA nucleotidyltransferase/poly(A) polymerase